MEKKQIDWSSIGFGYIPTEKRYVSNYKDGKWDDGCLTEDANIVLNECAGVLQYSQSVFEGMKAYKKTVDYCKSKGLVVIGDVKRGDIGSTSAAYATGHLGKVQVGSKTYSAFDEDFATVNPYLGSDGIKPFMEVCKEEKKLSCGGLWCFGRAFIHSLDNVRPGHYA